MFTVIVNSLTNILSEKRPRISNHWT